jgi:HSP20 family protein
MDPFQGVTDIISEINCMRQIGRGGHPPDDRDRTQASAWIPTTDIFARGNDLVIQLELAGVAAEEVDIMFAGGVLTISGDRRRSTADEAASFYVRERFSGAFRRSVSLDAGIDESNIDAYFENGLVEIVVRGGAVPGQSQRIALRARPSAQSPAGAAPARPINRPGGGESSP